MKFLLTALFFITLTFTRAQATYDDNDKMPNPGVEKMPEFPGGVTKLKEYINKKLKYPAEAEKNHIQGKVIVKFAVEKDGSITQTSVLKGINKELDAGALRVIQSMPNWIPGQQDGMPIRVYFNVPINFKLHK